MFMKNAQNVEYAFAVLNNVVREVYNVEHWFAAGKTACFTRSLEDVEDPKRIEFVGRIAPDDMRKRYLFKSVGDYFKLGSTNPMRYINR